MRWTLAAYQYVTGRYSESTSASQRTQSRIWVMNRTPHCPYCGVRFWHPDMSAHDHLLGDGATDRANGTRPSDEAGSIWASFASSKAYRTEEEAYAVYASKYQLICANCNNIKKTMTDAQMRDTLAKVKEVEAQ